MRQATFQLEPEPSQEWLNLFYDSTQHLEKAPPGLQFPSLLRDPTRVMVIYDPLLGSLRAVCDWLEEVALGTSEITNRMGR